MKCLEKRSSGIFIKILIIYIFGGAELREETIKGQNIIIVGGMPTIAL